MGKITKETIHAKNIKKHGGDIMTELEKCMAGEDYDCHAKIFLDFKSHARKLLQEYNALAYEQKQKKS